jgi:hypothetical protein
MKRNLLSRLTLTISLCICALVSVAQITVTRVDFAVAGDMTINANDTLPSVSTGSAGASQTWNLSGIANHYTDTTVFSNPGSTPYAANFPGANLAGYNSLEDAYYYVNASTSSVEIHGVVFQNPFTGNPLPLPFSPPQPQITFPATFGTAFSNTSTAASGAFYMNLVLDSSTNTVADSFRITQTVIRNSIVDGWGTTTTPAGTFNTLRQRIVDSTNTLIEAYVSIGGFPVGWQTLPFGGNEVSTEYSYIANGQKWAVAELSTDSAGNVTTASYLVNVVIGIDEFSASGNNDVIFYPNPSQGEVNISVLNSKADLLEVYDMLGKKIETLRLNGASLTHSFESLARGLYTFRVLDRSGAAISNGKFVIEK